MKGRRYYVTYDAATSLAAATPCDLFEIIPATDKPVALTELKIWQTSDFGDAQEEILSIQTIRGFTTSGSGGGTPTVAPTRSGDAAAGFTAECRNTTVAVTGTGIILPCDGWNVRVPYIWTPNEDDMPICTAAQTRMVVRLLVGPVDALTIMAQAIIEEVG